MALSCRTRKPSKVPSRDGRSPDAVLVRRTKAALLSHIGGKPSNTQRALIDRCAMVTLHLARMDERALQLGEFSDYAGRQYLAYSNSLARMLLQLGMEATRRPAPTVGRTGVAAHLAGAT